MPINDRNSRTRPTLRTVNIVAASIASMVCVAAVALPKERVSWLSRELAGRVAGPPSECITLSQVDGPMIVDRQTILYRQGGKRIWRMDLGESCPSLREDMILLPNHATVACAATIASARLIGIPAFPVAPVG